MMKKVLSIHISVRFFQASVIVLGLLAAIGGCIPVNYDRLLADVPDSPASIYEPSSPLPELIPIDDEVIPEVDGRILGLAQCIKIALERNPETQIAWQASRSAAAGVGQARAGYMPAADFSAGANRGDLVSLDSQQDTGAADTFEAGFGVRYLLFDGGARSAGLEGAESELLKVNFQHNTTLQNVALAVEEAYYQLLAAKELERVAEQTSHQTQYHLDVARARYKNGMVAKSDVLKAETGKAEADLGLVRARSQVRVTRGRLANAMGLNPSKSFAVAELPQDPHQRELADIKKLMAEATSSRPELRSALAGIESGRMNVKAAEASYWPEVTLNADYGWRDRTFAPERDEWSLGVGITLPLFDGFDRGYTKLRAKSELARTVAEHEKLLRGVELEVWTAYSRLIEADQAIEASQALVASAEESARVAEGEYKNGTGSIIEVTDAQTSRTSANVRLVQARLDWYTAMARLERAVGRTLA